MVTALALAHFGRRAVDIAVIETGLGGRLDATNCLSPVLTITTDISYDHMEILGRSLSRIANEKAGIIKTGVPHLVGRLPRDAHRVISQTCRERGSRLYRLSGANYSSHKPGLMYSFLDNGWRLDNVRQALLGEHQIRNGALVLRGVGVLRSLGFAISDKSARRGLKNTHWPARFQIIRQKGHPLIVVDVCHNTAGAVAFAKTFRQIFPKKKAQIIIGLVRRKEHDRMAEALAPIAREFHAVPLSSHRSVDVRKLAALLSRSGVKVTVSAKSATALKRALNSSSYDDIIAVLGSHYLAGEFLKDFEKK